MAEMEGGDIVKLSVAPVERYRCQKVEIVEAGSQNPEAVEAYVNAAVKTMGREKQVELAARILKLAQQQEGGKSC